MFRCFLAILIVLLFSSFGFSQSPQLADEYFKKARQLNKEGKLSEACSMFEKSVEAEKNSENPRLANLSAELNWAGYCYFNLGQYDRAIKHYEEALTIVRSLGRELEIARDLNMIGGVYESWGQYDKAIKHFEEALIIARRLGKEAYIALFLNNIGAVYRLWGRYDRGIKYFEEALTIFRKLGREAEIATLLNNIGVVYYLWGQYDKAIKYYEDALTIDRKLGREAEIPRDLNNIGFIYYSLRDYNKAIKYFLESVSLTEKLRKTAKGDVRRDYLESQLGTYQYLISTYIKMSDFGNAFSTIELSRAKLLAEQISGSEDVSIPSVKEIQKAMPEKSAVLIYANMNWKKDRIAMVITKEGIKGIELEHSLLDTFSGKHGNEVNAFIQGLRGIKIKGKEKEGALKDAKKENIGLDEIINYYRTLLVKPSEQSGDLGRMLHDFLIKPANSELKGKTSLIILPDGVLGFLPFESLIDGEGKYLAETYEIKYAQSMAVMNLINKRNYTGRRKPLLAFGGAVYDRITYSADMVNSEKQLSVLGKKVYQKIASRSSARDAYVSLGIAKWSNLPGTLSEVNEISEIVKGASVFKGDEVTEDKIKELSSKGELSKYKVIHFAVHGLVVPEMPELSAVVLSQFKTESGEDGYLRMGEIAELKLNADFVNLSACETGLGKIYGGEGVVGLTQSFLIAGANGLSVSLWQVEDASTSKFMTGLYELTEKKGMSYSGAVTEMKRRFIRGDFGESYKTPFYWAPFVYYGR